MFMDKYEAVDIFKALADPARLDIVRRLAKEPAFATSHDVVESCPSLSKLSQPAMSHHFNKLVDAGIIEETKTGTCKNYELNTKLLESVGINPNKL